jgi:hypothetical protein
MARARIKQGERPKGKGTSHDVKPNVGGEKFTRARPHKLDRKARSR